MHLHTKTLAHKCTLLLQGFVVSVDAVCDVDSP
jgi:hypothetical protein